MLKAGLKNFLFWSESQVYLIGSKLLTSVCRNSNLLNHTPFLIIAFMDATLRFGAMMLYVLGFLILTSMGIRATKTSNLLIDSSGSAGTSFTNLMRRSTIKRIEWFHLNSVNRVG